MLFSNQHEAMAAFDKIVFKSFIEREDENNSKPKEDACTANIVLDKVPSYFPSTEISLLYAGGIRCFIFHKYHVDVTGVFLQNGDSIVANLYLSFVDKNGKTITGKAKKEYIKAFQDSFEKQVKLFKNVLEAFFLDMDSGLASYYAKIESGEITTEKEKKQFIRNFLRKINIRCEIDDKISTEKAEKIEKVRQIAAKNEKNFQKTEK